MTAILTEREVDAHLCILDALNRVMDCRISDGLAFQLFACYLPDFAPRCNCGRRLRIGPWVDELRFVKCECGVSYREAKL